MIINFQSPKPTPPLLRATMDQGAMMEMLKSPAATVDFSSMKLPKSEAPKTGHTWWFWARAARELEMEVMRVGLDTGAQVVSLAQRAGSRMMRAQEKLLKKIGYM